jgi:hypothetical protein
VRTSGDRPVLIATENIQHHKHPAPALLLVCQGIPLLHGNIEDRQICRHCVGMASTTATASAVSLTSTPPADLFPGLTVDHDRDNDSYQASLIVCSVVTWVAALVFVAARFYTRRLLLRVWSCEDWIILFSLILSALCSVTVIIR